MKDLSGSSKVWAPVSDKSYRTWGFFSLPMKHCGPLSQIYLSRLDLEMPWLALLQA